MPCQSPESQGQVACIRPSGRPERGRDLFVPRRRLGEADGHRRRRPEDGVACPKSIGPAVRSGIARGACLAGARPPSRSQGSLKLREMP
jgi:hypothetical protein